MICIFGGSLKTFFFFVVLDEWTQKQDSLTVYKIVTPVNNSYG